MVWHASAPRSQRHTVSPLQQLRRPATVTKNEGREQEPERWSRGLRQKTRCRTQSFIGTPTPSGPALRPRRAAS